MNVSGSAIGNSTVCDNNPPQCRFLTVGVQGDDRFRHCLRNYEKRVEDAGLSRKRSQQNNKCQFKAH